MKSSEEILTSYQAIKEEIDMVKGALTDEKEKKAVATKEAAVAQQEVGQPETTMINTDEKKKEKGDEQHKSTWIQHVERLLDARVHLYAEHGTLTGNTNHLKELAVAKIRHGLAAILSRLFSLTA